MPDSTTRRKSRKNRPSRHEQSLCLLCHQEGARQQSFPPHEKMVIKRSHLAMLLNKRPEEIMPEQRIKLSLCRGHWYRLYNKALETYGLVLIFEPLCNLLDTRTERIVHSLTGPLPFNKAVHVALEQGSPRDIFWMFLQNVLNPTLGTRPTAPDAPG